MEKIIQALRSAKNKVAQVNPMLGEDINNTLGSFDSMPNKIETFAKPRVNVMQSSDEGTVHSFAVEIKAKHNGPIPDTQLMSKILQAVESHSDSTSEFASGDEPEGNSFEVVSFKYERREDKKNTK
jgi:pyruvate/2-oxoglutarate/acetoin dehydrogenase E1 component